MKKRSNTYSRLMLIPPMVLMALVWSPSSNAIDIDSDVPEIFTARSLAVIEGEQETLVTLPEEISSEDSTIEEQTSIEEASDEVVENTEGALPVESVQTVELAQVESDSQEEEEVEEIVEIEQVIEAEELEELVAIEDTDEVEEVAEQVTCEVKQKKKTLSEEVVSQEKDIMSQFNDFFQAVMVPMMANYISSQSFRAPPVQTGLTGIPAQNKNFGAGLGLNLLSLSDYYNARSMGFGATTVNNYNVTGNVYNGAYNNTMGSTPMGLSSMGMNNQFNAGMSQTMFNSVTASPHTFNFGMAVQDHSRFDQMNTQNTQAMTTPMTPLAQSAPLTTQIAPVFNGPTPAGTSLSNSNAPATNLNVNATRNTISE